jgi:DNA (cytosine-5)-methyltransferase 1
MPRTTAVIDIFCGIGGLTHGLRLAGLNVTVGIDLDASCRYAYETNNAGAVFIEGDVAKIPAKSLLKYFANADIKILAGCAPCQPFSQQTLRYRKDGHNDPRWCLLEAFSRKVKEMQPDIVVSENVPGLGREPILAKFIGDLQRWGYHVNCGVVYCADYGVPQKRKRLILLASRFGDLLLIRPGYSPESYRTVKQAIGGFPELRAGWQSVEDPLHICAGLTEINIRRLAHSRPGGTWREWDETLRLKRHCCKTGIGYGDVCGRLAWDKPSPTITTRFYGYGSGRFGHPEQNRAISLREGAVLQSFPRDYQFVPDGGEIKLRTLARHIGNAVPVELGRAVGLSILNHLRKKE